MYNVSQGEGGRRVQDRASAKSGSAWAMRSRKHQAPIETLR